MAVSANSHLSKSITLKIGGYAHIDGRGEAPVVTVLRAWLVDRTMKGISLL